MIALDRFQAVLHRSKPHHQKKKLFGHFLASWILSFFLALPTEMDFRLYVNLRFSLTVKSFSKYIPYVCFQCDQGNEEWKGGRFL